MLEVHRVPEPPVVEAHPAVELDRLAPRAPGGRQPVRRGGRRAVRDLGGPRPLVHPGRVQIERALHRQLRRVERAAPLRPAQHAAPQAERDPDLGPAQAQLAVRLDQLGLEVLRHHHPVRRDRPPPPVRPHLDLVDQQVRADLGVRQADAPPHPAARQVQVPLRVQPGRLQTRQRALHHPQGPEPGLGHHHLAVEPAPLQLHVRPYRPARQVQDAGDPRPAQLQGGHPPGPGLRSGEQQQCHHLGADAPLLPPLLRPERVVPLRDPLRQIARPPHPERPPQVPLRPRETVRHPVLARLGHCRPLAFHDPHPRFRFPDPVDSYSRSSRCVTG